MAIIRAENLYKYFDGFCAVNDVSISINPGEVVAFLGVNGAGKTTTLKMLTGIIKPDRGNIYIDGIDLVADPLIAKKMIGYIPDHPQLYDKLTAEEFLDFCGDLYKVPYSEKVRQIEELLITFNLHGKRNMLIESFSHGMKQRLATCAALIHSPKVLIIDEPIVGLDPHGAKLLIAYLRTYADQGNCVFLSTHTLPVAEKLANRVIIIDRGHIKAAGTIQEIREILGDQGQELEELFITLTAESYDSNNN